MSNYKRLGTCPKTFFITYHNESIDEAPLYVYEYTANNSTTYSYFLYAQSTPPGIQKEVYLGYEDVNELFDGNLSTAISNQPGNFQLDCNDDQCYGHFYISGDDTTGAQFRYSLNTCTSDRLITFSYKGTPIFKIQQIYYKKNLAVGDILYSTASGKLTLNAVTDGADNTPIAICVIPEVMENFDEGDDKTSPVKKTARFVSLNYMNCDTPATGSKELQYMYFGNYGVTIGNDKGGTNETSYVDGKWNTKQCVSKATKQDSGIVKNESGNGYCAPACCCDRYSTLGTKPGDWYLPSVGELYQLYEYKEVIDEKREALSDYGSGFGDYRYWSSRESIRSDVYQVNLASGYISEYSKIYGNYVLGFFALETKLL